MKAIISDTCTKAWFSAVLNLQKEAGWRDYTLVLEIADPMSLPADDRKVYEIVDAFLYGKAGIRLSTVVNTIFPATLFARRGADGIFTDFPQLWPKIHRHPRCQKWGSYAQRIIIGREANDASVGPLMKLIEKLKSQLNSGSPKRAAYEVGIATDVDLSIYEAEADGGRIMGGPCLSHLSFKLTGDRRLMLTALYRSHYYIHRALGNLYGLAWLQHFVAREVGIETSALICHSTMAKLDTLDSNEKTGVKGWNATDVKRLIGACGEVLGDPSVQTQKSSA